ncbi:hypothetical protein EJB05_34716, partial [Eragrostis curvula]
MADASSERTPSAPEQQQDDSNSSTSSPTKAQLMVANGEIPKSMDYWKPGELTEEYIAELRRAGWISAFVTTRENTGSECFSFNTTEIPVFESHFICGFNLPPSHFLERVCKYYKIELIHLKPQAITLLSIFSILCECWLGTAPSLDLWRDSWSDFKWRYFVMDDSEKHDIKGKGLLPFHQGWNKSIPIMDDRLERMVAKVTELVKLGLRGEHIVEEFIRRCIFPLQRRDPLAMFVAELPEEIVQKRVWDILEPRCNRNQRIFQHHTVPPTVQKRYDAFYLIDIFGPDPSEGGLQSAMVIDSSSSEKEPKESPKKSSAEAFADDVLNHPRAQDLVEDQNSLDEKGANLKATLLSDDSLEPLLKSKPSSKSKPSKPSPSEASTLPKVQPALKRKLKSLLTTPATSPTELPNIHDTANPGDQVPLSIVFGTLFAGFSHISQIRASQGKQTVGVKRPRVRASGHVGTVVAPASTLPAPSGSSSSELSVFGKIVQDAQAENNQLHLKLSESPSSPALIERDTKISQLEAALVGANQALADLKTAHASEVKTLQDTNNSLATSFEAKLLEEKLALKDQDLQTLQQKVSFVEADKKKLIADREQVVEEGYARCIAGSAYTIALFKHHFPDLDLALLETGFKCDPVQCDVLVDHVNAEADSFVTALKLVPDATPAEEQVPAEETASGDDKE